MRAAPGTAFADFLTDAAQAVSFMDDHDTTGLASSSEDGGFIERFKAAQVDDLGGDAFCCQDFRRLRTVMHCLAVGNEADIFAGAQSSCPAERNRRGVERHFARLVKQANVKQEDNRIVVADGRLEQRTSIGR